MSALISIVFGALGFFLFRLYPIEFPKEIAGILLSLFGFVFTEGILTYFKKSKKIRLKNIYQK